MGASCDRFNERMGDLDLIMREVANSKDRQHLLEQALHGETSISSLTPRVSELERYSGELREWYVARGRDAEVAMASIQGVITDIGELHRSKPVTDATTKELQERLELLSYDAPSSCAPSHVLVTRTGVAACGMEPVSPVVHCRHSQTKDQGFGRSLSGAPCSGGPGSAALQGGLLFSAGIICVATCLPGPAAAFLRGRCCCAGLRWNG